MELEFLFSGNSILLFIAFLSSCRNHYELKNPFPQAEMKNFLETFFTLDGKNLSLIGTSEKYRKKSSLLARKSVVL